MILKSKRLIHDSRLVVVTIPARGGWGSRKVAVVRVVIKRSIMIIRAIVTIGEITRTIPWTSKRVFLTLVRASQTRRRVKVLPVPTIVHFGLMIAS